MKYDLHCTRTTRARRGSRTTPTHRKRRSAFLAATALLLAVGIATSANAQDLAIDSVTASNLQAGNCNSVTVTIRNTSDQLINQITGAKVIAFPTATPFQNRSEKTAFFSAIGGGATMTRTVNGLGLLGGQQQHTVQVLIDFQNQVAETNENNNLDQRFETPNQTCGGGLCDLKAESLSAIKLGSTRRVNAKFRNVGGSQCPQSTIQIQRFEGSSASGTPTDIATATLTASGPNQTRTAISVDSSPPSSGTHTYAYQWVGNPPDQNTQNNFLTKTVNFGGSAPPGPRPSNGRGCDLRAQFITPTGTTAAANSTVPFQVAFINQGSAPCITAKIRLSRTTGTSCGGYGSYVGGSGALETLPALGPNQSHSLTWTERRSPRRGTYCYRMKYSPAFNDDNNGNHHPKKTVSFQ